MATGFEDAAKRELTAEVIRNFGEVCLRVTGTSMLPLIWPGDVITIRRKSPDELLVGQIVLCYRNQTFVAHRLIGMVAGGFITRGDSLAYDDPSYRHAEVLGEVVAISREGRMVAMSVLWWHSIGRRIARHSQLCARILMRLQRSSKLSWAE